MRPSSSRRSQAGYVWWALVLFTGALVGMYVFQPPERRFVGFSFFLSALFGCAGLSMLGAVGGLISASWPVWLGYGLFFAIEAALFGLMNLGFKNRLGVYGVLNTALLLLSFIFFFGTHQELFSSVSRFPEIVPLFLGVTVALLIREAFVFSGITWGPRALAVGAAFGFIAVEVSLLMLFLPLGFVNAAVFMALLVFLARDGAIAGFQGAFSVRFILRELTIFIVLAVVIFSVSPWSI